MNPHDREIKLLRILPSLKSQLLFKKYLLDLLQDFQLFCIAVGQVTIVSLVGKELGHLGVGSSPGVRIVLLGSRCCLETNKHDQVTLLLVTCSFKKTAYAYGNQ